jgi:hypothetical protein
VLQAETRTCLPRRGTADLPDAEEIWTRPAYVERFLDNYLQVGCPISK